MSLDIRDQLGLVERFSLEADALSQILRIRDFFITNPKKNGDMLLHQTTMIELNDGRFYVSDKPALPVLNTLKDMGVTHNIKVMHYTDGKPPVNGGWDSKPDKMSMMPTSPTPRG